MSKIFYILGIIFGFSIGLVFLFCFVFCVYYLIERHKSKKLNIEKLIEEEESKDFKEW